MGLTKEPLVYLATLSAAIFVVYAKFLAVVRTCPDSLSYQDFRFDSLQEIFNNIRTVGYPLFLSSVESISSNLNALPYIQFWLFALAVIFFYLSLKMFGFPKWLAFFASVPLLFERILLQFAPYVMTETLGAALAIASVSLFLIVQSKPRSTFLWLVLSLVVFVTYQVRPVYVFLVFFLPLLQLVMGRILRTQGRELVRLVGVTLVVLILPLTAVCSFRYMYAGHFGLAPLFGRNLAVTTTQFLTKECAEGLDPEMKRFVMEMIRIRDERFGVERTKTMVPMTVAFDYWLASGEVFGEAIERVFGKAVSRDAIACDNIGFKIALATIKTRPLQLMIYYWKLFFYGISFTMYAEVTIPILLIMLFACFLLARTRSRPSRRPAQGTQEESASTCFTVLVVLSVLFYFVKLLFVISAQFTEARYLMAAALFLPGMISAAIALFTSREFNWPPLQTEVDRNS